MPESRGRTSYDELPYPSFPFPLTHPDRLGTIATLLGMKPAGTERCWVLELGCAAGGNLIPMALALPESTFVGIDQSAEQIAEGKRTVEALGLTNISLHHLDIMEVGPDFGEFDFIICHGVYSWVPERVQDQILKINKQCLAPHGVGFISYNTYPGWHMRGMIRAMMGRHDRRFRDQLPLVRVGQARALLSFLAKSAPAGDGPYGLLLREHLNLLTACSDAYLFHEHLEECNEPVYFSDFCDRLTARGLRFLAEAELGVMVPSTSFPPQVQDELRQVAPNLIDMEQYMDFLRNRMFRQTLVCHDHVRPCYEIKSDHVFGFHVASSVQPGPGGENYAADVSEEFKGRNDMVLSTASPVVKAAARCLAGAWPQALAFDRLLDAARARLKTSAAEGGAARDEEARALARALLTAFATSGKPLVELYRHPPVFTTEISASPLASPLVRHQAQTTTQLTSLRHEVINVTEVDRHLLLLLDGRRDRGALRDGLVEQHAQGNLEISSNDQPVTDRAQAAAILAEVVEQRLPRLAKEALLVD
jgi:methyltransferase-like protein/SAM-dependent methyltransferase